MVITEDYVSFETAKLLKNNGFGGKCNSYFISNNEIALIANKRDFNKHGIYLSAPTLQMAMKWLRETHKICIIISPISSKGYAGILCDVADFDDFNYIKETDCFLHPEEAIEAAINYCLKHLI